MNWMALLFLLVAVLFGWLGLRTMRNNPDLFSKESIGKSVQTLGVLALALIAFIAVLVMMLKH